ncbi:28S ribosomal protein S24, mitochondrial [Chelonus insularis]|uniref:28S ribosomal protein S24, mitochondrial n=1 Tax=Chelonus insularis TaxID=460826 RepID=UPI00158C7701|nr:28S ribosomal protein S24, mitochondrial [Chelonus insularis]
MALIVQNVARSLQIQSCLQKLIHTSASLNKTTSGKYKSTRNRTKPLTYEMAMKPWDIAARKSWNAWNTSNVLDGNRPAETAAEDEFIRRFMCGTWHNIFVSELIIKRQHNIIRIAGIIQRNLAPRKMYFLIGYTQELLSYWLQCPVKLELQSVESKEDVVFRYV